ncbi:MAG TPA: diguanylate cyclase [Solirubrobacteraceae bacterium]|jgi:diguanylate cyclase (GGDEF)-like protein/putative nucleotidyltransferase with HDIG domain|nr:diguanylate cyclase [Solirubrobacteraceae bacterium]
MSRDEGAADAAGARARLSQADANFGGGLKAHILAALFAAGATLALLTLALPHSPRADAAGIWAIAGIAYVVAALLFWRADGVGSGVLALALGGGTTLITGVAYFSAEDPSPLIFLYLWVYLYSAYFFSTRVMLAQIAYVAVTYVILLTARSPMDGVAAWWLVGMGTLAVAAVVIRVMRERVDVLIARLYESARSDPLTQLANRRGFRETLDLELARARRRGGQMTVIVCDLDRFKEVSDRGGHRLGDTALQRVAAILLRGKREIDSLARVGGGEFALVLPDTEEQGAFVTAERLRSEVRDEFCDASVPVTLSLGIASYPRAGETAAALLRATDEALLAARQNGCDRTMLHSPAMRSAPQLDGEGGDIAAERLLAVMLDLAEAVDLRFSGTARHSETVGRYAEMMASELGLSEEHIARVRLAGLLHDIGKVGVPDSILQKPARLSDDELAVIRRHPELGAQMLDHASLADVRQWVGTHHEQPDGHGYPQGLSGDAIPLEARIIAVADAYEAMTSDRSYRSSLDHEAAQRELQRCAGTQFDPRVVVALVSLLERETERAVLALGHS